MFDSDIYKDMAARSGGEIYIGVVAYYLLRAQSRRLRKGNGRIAPHSVHKAGRAVLFETVGALHRRAGLFEFPVTSVDVKIPDWIRVMPADSSAISELLVRVRDACAKVEVMRECSLFDEAFANSKF